MAKQMTVVIIHGIGVSKSRFADPLISALKAEFNNQITMFLRTRGDYAQDLDFRKIGWEGFFDDQQQELNKRIHDSIGRFSQPLIGKWWEKSAGDFFKESLLEVMELIGYNESRQLIFNRIEQTLGDTHVATSLPITVVAHSLGTVFSTDFIHYKQHHPNRLQGRFNLANFFTMGSPINSFALEYGQNELRPVYCENSTGRWVNIFDHDDPVANRLKLINKDYERAVLKDQEVMTGFFDTAHSGYWTNQEVHRIIGHKLVLDWLKLNNKILENEFKQRLHWYDQNLCLS